jgi:hypothetical protein
MAHCSPLGEATASAAEVENIDRVAVTTEVEQTIGENPATSNGEGCLSSLDAAIDSLGKVALMMKTCEHIISGRQLSPSVKSRRW